VSTSERKGGGGLRNQSSGKGVPATTVVSILALVIALFVAIGLWRLGSSVSKQACVAKVAQEYPGVPVSAFDTQETGALKLSYDVERRKAVQEC